MCSQQNRILDPAIVELLLSHNAKQTNTYEYTLPLDVWLKLRETIASIRSAKQLGSRRVPFLWVTAFCAQCGGPMTRRSAELDKQYRKSPDYKPTCSVLCCGRFNGVKKQKELVKFNCAYCGKESARMRCELDKKMRANPDYAPVCSLSCATRLNNSRRGMTAQATCNNCGKPVYKHGARACSDECRKAIAKKSGAVRRKEMSVIACLVCGAAIQQKTLAHTPKYCSVACKNTGHALLMAGDGNPTYKHGLAYNRYLPGEQRLYRDARNLTRARDGYACVVCGTTKRLNTHHIDMNPQNNTVSNLVTLCHDCHVGLHAAERRKPSTILYPWLSEYVARKQSMTCK